MPVNPNAVRPTTPYEQAAKAAIDDYVQNDRIIRIAYATAVEIARTDEDRATARQVGNQALKDAQAECDRRISEAAKLQPRF
jgi:hypothetical protein